MSPRYDLELGGDKEERWLGTEKHSGTEWWRGCCRRSAANRAIDLAIGVNTDGNKEVLGLWTAPTEGAKFRLSVVTELKNRGVKNILIACVDGLKGFPEAIAAVYLTELWPPLVGM